jgi:hypothetical protein
MSRLEQREALGGTALCSIQKNDTDSSVLRSLQMQALRSKCKKIGPPKSSTHLVKVTGVHIRGPLNSVITVRIIRNCTHGVIERGNDKGSLSSLMKASFTDLEA